MNDKLKQIEEMAKALCVLSTNCGKCEEYSECDLIAHAIVLVEQGYCKIDEGSVILTEEEYERIERSNFQEGISEGRKEIKDMYDELHLRHAECLLENKKLKDSNKILADREFTLSIQLEQTRKQAVKEVLQEVYKHASGEWWYKIAEKFGVEL